MTLDVRTEQAGPRALAAVRAATTPQRLSADLIGLLDLVWPVLREQGVRTGHNVVIYRGGEDGALDIEAGVEVFGEFRDRDRVQHAATPAGEVATVAYYGAYSGLAAAYGALEQWCRDRGRQPAGVNWEVYGDWHEDPAQVRTDVYFLLEALQAG